MREFTEGQFWAACRPLFDLLDITPMHTYDWPRAERTADGLLTVKFRKVVEPDKPREGWPVVAHGEQPETAEWAYEVNIAALPSGGPEDVWGDQYPTASSVKDAS